VSDVFWQPIWLFRLLHLGPPDTGPVWLVQVVWKLALALAALGCWTWLSTAVAFFAGFYLLALPNNFGKIHHFDAILVVVLGILAVSRCGDAFSIDALRRRSPAAPSGEYCWPIKAVWLALSVVYLTAGTAKLWTSGLGWITSDNMRLLLIMGAYHTANADPLPGWGTFVANVPGMARLFAAATVAIEVLYPLAMVSTGLRWILVPAALAMHLGIRVLMGPTFTQFFFVNVFWVPWEQLAQAARGALAARAAQATKVGRPTTEP